MEEQRSALEIFPERVYNICNEWQLRVMVLLSLALQIGLIIIANRRKRTTSNCVMGLFWLMYLSADFVATVALGILSNRVQEDTKSSSGKYADPRSVIVSVWASFLLLHLGGPDTITAYSLEDNDLWRRHLLGQVVHVVGALYVFFMSQLHTQLHELIFLAIPIFVAGFIKYGERTWALRSASRMRHANALYHAPSIQDEIIASVDWGPPKTRRGCARRIWRELYRDTVFSYHLHEAFTLFEFLRDAYGNVPLDNNDKDVSYNLLWGKSAEEAFRLVDIELGFLYDMIYTKAPIIWYNKFGFFLRIIAFLASISALLIFCLIIDKKPYTNIDTSITYLFAFGAVFLEIFSFILMLISDWSVIILLSKFTMPEAKRVYRAISWLSSTNDHKIRWSGSMGQYNLYEFATENSTMLDPVLRFIGIYEVLLKNRYMIREKVSPELKELVFRHLWVNREKALVPNDIEKVCSWRGDEVLRKNDCLDKFAWSIVKVEFDYSIILWHIATTICYDLELARCQGDSNSSLDSKCKMSKSLSDYMIYLLFVNPSMLPMGNGLRTFLEAWVHAKCSEGTYVSIKRNGRKTRKKVLFDISNAFSLCSSLNDGYRLARGLQSLETDREEEQRWTNGKKWEMISQVWVEMLCYVACRCEWKDHAKQLRRGGEFLTHVSVLMFHLGYAPFTPFYVAKLEDEDPTY